MTLGDLAAGGHLTHGAPPNMSGKWFQVVSYGVRPKDQRGDLEQVASLARGAEPTAQFTSRWACLKLQ